MCIHLSNQKNSKVIMKIEIWLNGWAREIQLVSYLMEHRTYHEYCYLYRGGWLTCLLASQHLYKPTLDQQPERYLNEDSTLVMRLL